MSDLINKPEHYNQVGFECIDIMRMVFSGDDRLFIGFLLGNAFKYIWRHKAKNGTEDLDKAEWYLNYAEKCIDSMTISGQHIYHFLKKSLKKARGEE